MEERLKIERMGYELRERKENLKQKSRIVAHVWRGVISC
jgi:hypothetical protein